MNDAPLAEQDEKTEEQKNQDMSENLLADLFDQRQAEKVKHLYLHILQTAARDRVFQLAQWGQTERLFTAVAQLKAMGIDEEALEGVDALNVIIRRAASQNREEVRENFLVISMSIREDYVEQLQEVLEKKGGGTWELDVRDNFQNKRGPTHTRACMKADAQQLLDKDSDFTVGGSGNGALRCATFDSIDPALLGIMKDEETFTKVSKLLDGSMSGWLRGQGMPNDERQLVAVRLNFVETSKGSGHYVTQGLTMEYEFYVVPTKLPVSMSIGSGKTALKFPKIFWAATNSIPKRDWDGNVVRGRDASNRTPHSTRTMDYMDEGGGQGQKRPREGGGEHMPAPSYAKGSGKGEDYTRVYLSHSWDSSQAVHTHSHTIRTLFAQSSHRILSYYSHTILTLFAWSHTIRTLFAHDSHVIRTLFARSHTVRAVLTLFAPSSHQIRRLFAPRSHYSRGGGDPVRTHSRSIRTVHTRSHL